MKLIAHRGIHKIKEEQNTLGAFINAINNDEYVGFECDVRQTKDKKFIINHDAFIENKLIKFTNLKDLKIKKIFKLADVLKLNTKKIMLIEIKDLNIDINKFNKILKRYKNKNIYVMSFHNSILNKLYYKPHNYKLGLLDYVLNKEENYKYDFVCLLNNLTSKDKVKLYLKNNKEVFIYGMLGKKEFKYGDKCYYIFD